MEIASEMIPPDEMIKGVGGGRVGFLSVGREFVRYFRELGQLRPDERVLDVGCGIGRMAVPLTQYLDETGRYDGFDIHSARIRWCQENIAARFPNFRFSLVDIHNAVSNPNGRIRASEYQFPYDDESFDFAFLTSVFTHMLPEDMETYCWEISRVLRRGGRTLITYFLLNEESLELIGSGKSKFDFRHGVGKYRALDPAMHEAAVAYDEGYVLDLYQRVGMSVIYPIHYGSWCGRQRFLSGQDIVVASKR